MAFRFSLDTLLDYREALERRELLALERAQQEVLGLELQIRGVQQEQVTIVEGRQSNLRRGMKACELQALIEAEVALERRNNELTEMLRKSMLKREECLTTYREIRGKRELLEKLRSRKLAEYTREQSQAEQRRIDDVYLSRRKRTQ